MSYNSSFYVVGDAGQISSQMCNISFLGLRPVRGGNWVKCGLLKDFF